MVTNSEFATQPIGQIVGIFFRGRYLPFLCFLDLKYKIHHMDFVEVSFATISISNSNGLTLRDEMTIFGIRLTWKGEWMQNVWHIWKWMRCGNSIWSKPSLSHFSLFQRPIPSPKRFFKQFFFLETSKTPLGCFRPMCLLWGTDSFIMQPGSISQQSLTVRHILSGFAVCNINCPGSYSPSLCNMM